MNLYPSEIRAAYRVALSRDELLEAQRAADTLKRLGFIAEAKEIYKKVEKQALQ